MTKRWSFDVDAALAEIVAAQGSPANSANHAKNQSGANSLPANELLMTANLTDTRDDRHRSLATVSNQLAGRKASTNGHLSAISDFSNELNHFYNRVQIASTLDDLRGTLEQFAGRQWHITERAALSAAYTPRALKLIDAEHADRYKTLEELAALCWGTSSTNAGA